MPEWSRREVLRGLGVAGTAGVLGGGWYLAERPHCRPPDGTAVDVPRRVLGAGRPDGTRPPRP
ncbi:twin-arginine translocation signal domain-containing protein [Halogeometricum sp. CBA1124]|uniref:twin-arginine translocation signal domain-containing protein n=1 Tax=Halogeometricum sp. CBA1124 TaxID=2668071 RepID=UPI001E35C6D9|nr:twin-arginine translocation signal domain-containing protein [Halogeometricum sp. CBA1124]